MWFDAGGVYAIANIRGGGSNGGLLVGAALTQRPDLFRALLAYSPYYQVRDGVKYPAVFLLDQLGMTLP